MQNETIARMRAICDDFVAWQQADGGISKKCCPYFAKAYKPFFRYMEVPFMGRALYALYDVTREEQYKLAADRYMLFYVDLVCDLIPTERIAYKFGMALEAAALYIKNNPLQGLACATYSRLLLKWLRSLRDKKLGSWFRCGYLPGTPGIKDATDVGFSDDLCHVGRGLIRSYEILKEPGILEDMERLAAYFATDLKDGTQDGIWSPQLGTWAIGPWPDMNFEHMSDTPANRAGWVFSSYGDSEFLLDAAPYLKQQKLADTLTSYSVQSVKWVFEHCWFEDGAVGMTGLDDKWLGLTAAAVLGVVRLYQHRALDERDRAYFRPYVEKSWAYLLAHTGAALPEAGYEKVTGHTSPVPGDNVAWLLAWVVECLAAEDTVRLILQN